MRTADWIKIKKMVEAGTYKMVRLCKVDPDGSMKPIIAYNKVTSKKLECLDRLEFIKSRISSLPVGLYQVQCKVSPTNHALVDVYDLEIKDKQVIHINANGSHQVIDKTSEQEDMGHQIDFHDHIKLIEDNAELRAQVNQLTVERDMWKQMYQDAPTQPALSEGPVEKEKTIAEIGIQALSENVSVILPALAEQFFGLKNRQLDLEEKKLMSNQNQRPVKRLPLRKAQERDLDAEAEQMADALDQIQDDEEFNQQLDELEQADPDLYNKVGDLLGLFEEGEEQQ